jgi:hypothetical protein
VVADTAPGGSDVHYQVLCRLHHRHGELGGSAATGISDQLSLDV